MFSLHRFYVSIFDRIELIYDLFLYISDIDSTLCLLLENFEGKNKLHSGTTEVSLYLKPFVGTNYQVLVKT